LAEQIHNTFVVWYLESHKARINIRLIPHRLIYIKST
jgi:hypothetical protein